MFFLKSGQLTGLQGGLPGRAGGQSQHGGNICILQTEFSFFMPPKELWESY